MDETMKEFQKNLVELELEGEQLLFARHQVIENDRLRNGTREALTALRRRARTTSTSVLPPPPFAAVMGMVTKGSSPLVTEVCSTCGGHDPEDRTWMMFPGSDLFARVPFHAAHSLLERDQEHLDHEAKILRSFMKEKSLVISEKGALADKITPGVLRSLVTLTDKPS